MELKKLKKLLKKEEGPKLDFKLKIDLESEGAKKEFAKDVCAIANSRGGRGYLIIGVEDKTRNIVGVKGEKISEEQIQQIISTRCEPPIPVSIEYIDYESVEIGVITIYDSPQSPFQFRETGSFYVRRGSTTDTMRKQELISAFQENLNLNVELCQILKSSVSNLNYEIIDKYLRLKGMEINEENRLELMEQNSIVNLDKETGQYIPTVGGLLVFCNYNNIFIPQNMIKIINKINDKSQEVNIISGNLIKMLDDSYELLKKVIPENYPIDAVFEGIKNAILYRDYSVYGKEIEVLISDKYLTILSPGNLLKDFTYSNPGNQAYMRRNMWIYEKLITLDEKMRFHNSGRGFEKMKKAFKQHGKVTFINSYQYNYFKVIFPGINNFK